MSLFGKLFGTKPEPAPQVEEYKGYRIYPDPQQDGKSWRLAARIERDIDGQTRVHHLVRADVLQDRDDCAAAAATKARQVIDEQGDSMFR